MALANNKLACRAIRNQKLASTIHRFAGSFWTIPTNKSNECVTRKNSELVSGIEHVSQEGPALQATLALAITPELLRSIVNPKLFHKHLVLKANHDIFIHFPLHFPYFHTFDLQTSGFADFIGLGQGSWGCEPKRCGKGEKGSAITCYHVIFWRCVGLSHLSYMYLVRI